ncbi:MAG: hypothetical protein U0547_03035 [Dehalococcoidia bacterium]
MDWLRGLINWLGALFSRGSSSDEGWVEPSNLITRTVLAMDEELPPLEMEPVVAEEIAPEPEPTPEPVIEPAAAEVAAPSRKKSDDAEEEPEEAAKEPAAEERAA